MSLERFCRKRVVTAQASEPVVDVARRMRDEHVGSVVIVSTDGAPTGIVTDRDLVVRALAEGGDPAAAIETIMTPAPVTLERNDRLDDVVACMREHGIRRIPVIDERGALVGLVSLDDINVLLAGELSASVAAVQDNRGP
jgi:CBS domain-containing protein